MNDLRDRGAATLAQPHRRVSLRRRWRRVRQAPTFQRQVIRTAQLAALALLLVITAVLVYRAMTVV